MLGVGRGETVGKLPKRLKSRHKGASLAYQSTRRAVKARTRAHMRRGAGFFVVLAGCASCRGPGSGGASGAASAAAPTSAAAPASASAPGSADYRVRPVASGRAVEVHLSYAGKPRAPWVIPAAFASHCGGATEVPDPSLDVDAKGGVTGAIASIDDIHEGDPPPTAGVTLDQKACVFAPHVLALPAGGNLRLTNGDPADHAVRLDVAGGSDADFVVKMLPPGGTETLAVRPAWSDHVARISCPIHPWMLAWARVFEHPYFAVTRGGVARIEKVPPGTWHLSVWHEALDAKLADTVEQGKPTQARFDVTVADRDVVRTLTLGPDGSIR